MITPMQLEFSQCLLLLTCYTVYCLSMLEHLLVPLGMVNLTMDSLFGQQKTLVFIISNLMPIDNYYWANRSDGRIVKSTLYMRQVWSPVNVQTVVVVYPLQIFIKTWRNIAFL